MTLRRLILDNVRRRALTALWKGDVDRWNRATDILKREGQRIQRSYTARKEMAVSDA